RSRVLVGDASGWGVDVPGRGPCRVRALGTTSPRVSAARQDLGMALPELDLARVRRWVAEQNERIGEHIGEMRIEADIDGRAVTIVECRPPWKADRGQEW